MLKNAPAYRQAGIYFVPLILRRCDVRPVRLTPQDFACLREAASAKAGAPRIWAFLSILNKRLFQKPVKTLEMELNVKRQQSDSQLRRF